MPLSQRSHPLTALNEARPERSWRGFQGPIQQIPPAPGREGRGVSPVNPLRPQQDASAREDRLSVRDIVNITFPASRLRPARRAWLFAIQKDIEQLGESRAIRPPSFVNGGALCWIRSTVGEPESRLAQGTWKFPSADVDEVGRLLMQWWVLEPGGCCMACRFQVLRLGWDGVPTACSREPAIRIKDEARLLFAIG